MPTDAEYEAALARVAARKAEKEDKKDAASVGRKAGNALRNRKSRLDRILMDGHDTAKDERKPVR